MGAIKNSKYTPQKETSPHWKDEDWDNWELTQKSDVRNTVVPSEHLQEMNDAQNNMNSSLLSNMLVAGLYANTDKYSVVVNNLALKNKHVLILPEEITPEQFDFITGNLKKLIFPNLPTIKNMTDYFLTLSPEFVVGGPGTYKRKSIKDKGSILGLIAGLMCDKIYHLNWDMDTSIGPIKTVTKASEKTSDILLYDGFVYDDGSVKNARKKILRLLCGDSARSYPCTTKRGV